MVQLSQFADTPLVARLSKESHKVVSFLSKVPTERWRAIVLALALIWSVQSLAKLFWLVMPQPKSGPEQLVPTNVNAGVQAKAPLNIDGLTSAHLFGDYDAEKMRAAQADQQAGENVNQITQLDLKLQGVIMASDPEKSWAIIGEENSQQLFKIGDSIPPANGVTLEKVEDLRVILNNNGKREALWLYGEDGMNVASSRQAAAAPPPPPPPANVQQATVTQEQLQSATSIGDVVRFMVATEGGKMIGYKVRPGRKRELFDQVGLKNDDIVISVNGIEVNEPQKVREVYQALKTASEANLQVLRDGGTQSIQIRMSSG
ncbi:MAG TPA: type II secretion system protein GspC [Cellvibrionaceae bacterium]|nr:type II secretion system protein GspC [Cellvibrionaceae bacterium]HMW48488.1 type II secretion system protein GspC [Cellvibrionaceae bacterium]HNG58705.1 type II secretion system protein GspC [Cellvibrionaceae bacterium]